MKRALFYFEKKRGGESVTPNEPPPPHYAPEIGGNNQIKNKFRLVERGTKTVLVVLFLFCTNNMLHLRMTSPLEWRGYSGLRNSQRERRGGGGLLNFQYFSHIELFIPTSARISFPCLTHPRDNEIFTRRNIFPEGQLPHRTPTRTPSRLFQPPRLLISIHFPPPANSNAYYSGV